MPSRSFDVFLINLKEDDSRLSDSAAHLGFAGLTFQRIDAIRGSAVPAELQKQFEGSPLTAGEIGCYASHLLAMSKVVRPTLICEDNIAIADPATFKANLEKAIAAMPPNWDHLHLRTSKKATAPVAKLVNDYRLVRHSKIPRGAIAYVLSPTGAGKLLKPRPRAWTIDDDIKSAWIFDLNVFGIQPGLVERGKAPSTIDTVAKRGDKFRHFRTFDSARLLKGVPFNIKALGLNAWVLCSLKNLVGVR